MNRICHILTKAVIPALTAAAFAACDNIDEADRYIEVEKVHSQKVVLIEKFTGLGCVNCPAGDEMIHNIQEAYPGQVVAVSLHPKPGISMFNRKYGTFDLRSAEAQPYFEYYGVNAMPFAVFDGMSNENSSNAPKWSSVVKELLVGESPVNISLTAGYDDGTRTATAEYSVDVLDPIDADGISLLCWVIEDHIIGPQKFVSGVDDNYEHNHVFRASANGTWGTALTDAAAAKGAKFEGSCSIDLDPAWEARNCRFVAFVFETASKKVLQTSIIDILAFVGENN